MDEAKDLEIEGGVDERAGERERRVEITEGIMERDLVSYYSAFSGMKVPCTAI
jgi:hypothetical protein